MNDETLLATYKAAHEDIVCAQSRLTELKKGRLALKKLIIGRGLSLPSANGQHEQVIVTPTADEVE